MEHSLSITVKARNSLSRCTPGSNAQINGSDDRALQVGIDYLNALGGGTLKILPGEYRLNNAIHLRSHIRLEGSGAETVLIKTRSIRIRGNQIVETRGPGESVGVRIGEKTADIVLEDNEFSGLAATIEDRRKQSFV